MSNLKTIRRNSYHTNLLFCFLLFLYSCNSSRMIIPPKGQTYVPMNKFVNDGEVTNKEYRQFLNDLKLKNDFEKLKIAKIDSIGWKYAIVDCSKFITDYQTSKYDNYPVVNITYEGAKLYCEWLTERYNNNPKREYKKLLFRLPTEMEWEEFAKGGKIDYIYPDGYSLSILNNKKFRYTCNFAAISQGYVKYNIKDELIIEKDSTTYFAMDDFVQIKPIKSYFPNEYGLFDFAGNVAEMVAEKGITKGGGWESSGYYMRIKSSERYTESSCNIGFRVMADIIEEFTNKEK